MQKDMKKDIRREVVAGITGFFAISYIIIVNPMILADGGIPADLSVFATIFSSVIGCLIMAFYADAPIILTPGMGINAFFTYTVVASMGLAWQEALAISLAAAVLFAIVACTRLRTLLAAAVPASLKTAITVGIGLFLVEIGLEKAQLIRRGTNTIIELGDLTSPMVLLAIFGLVLSLAFYLRKVTGGFVLAILITSAVAWALGLHDEQPLTIELSRLADYPALFAQFDFGEMLSLPFLLSVFSMAMIMIFESLGILEGILPDHAKFDRTFRGSAAAALISSFLGTSPTVVAAESATGIASGGRKGIMALTAAVLFLGAMLFVPLLSFVPQAAIAPVIIITGAMMMQNLAHMDFSDFTEWFPAFLIVVLIPLTGSISTGLAFGFTAWPLLKFLGGERREVHIVSACLGVLFFFNLVCQAWF
ncbi:NCS2 family permease [uncultured Selenomonas sp.]|uniref:NCS2 family permease n=1 Tax=uncultured Selenomonas sp. TaxID=159275 RepID=UPI0025F5B5DB|nr:NCS2 family permease [uncultured Selenomonas sp.]MDD6126540.1 NCS2 family permease [Veillonellaceae bacterium]